MKLTSLEVRGFKSFGDKAVIHFDEGVTSIVGPNGCGKSNVVDAIRWVLGEQSTRALRSEKMENIIFNGSSSRKQSNLAEVSLSFDNTKNILPTEFNQVTVTRKLFRSGESEYRLNDVQCRLKDITDLFLDTGIGADSYSIIELKMVDEILNNKDNSRRNLFEEASGIAKYKIRKKQTFAKLRDTEADLARVEDLLHEIDKNLKTLESQARKTERFYKLKDQYQELSTQLASFRIHAFRTSLETLQKQETEQQDLQLQLQTETDQLEASIQEAKQGSLVKEKNLATQQKATNEYIASIRQYENEKKLKNEQLKFQQEKESRLQAELSNDKLWLERTRESLGTLEDGQKKEQEALRAIEDQLTTLKAALDKLREQESASKTELEEAGAEIRRLQDEAYQAEKEKDILIIQKDTLEQELQRNTSDVQQKQAEISEFSTAISSLEKRRAEQERLLEEATALEKENRQQQESGQQEIQELREQLAACNRTRDAKENEYRLTKSLVDNLEGYPESIRFLRKHAGWAAKAPLLSDVLFCEEAYRIPVENYLESYMNYYVVETYQQALQAIDLLSESSKGRAHFFVLEAFRDYKVTDPGPAPAPGGIPALDIIECEEAYKALCHFLLHRVWLLPDGAKEPEPAVPGSAPATDGIVLLSQSGKYSRERFSISGGFVGLFEGKRIGRVKNLEALQKEIKKLDGQLQKYTSRKEELTARLEELQNNTRQDQIAELRSTLSGLSAELLTLQTREEQHREFISGSDTRREDIEQKLQEYTGRLKQLEPRLEELNGEREEKAEKLLGMQRDHNQLSEKVSKASAEYNQLNISFHQQKNKLDSLLKDLQYKHADQERYSQRILTNTAELEETREQITGLLQTSDDSDAGLLEMYAQKEAMEKALGEAEEDYYQSKGAISELESRLSGLRQKKDQNRVLADEIREKKTQLKIDLNALKERLSVEFNIDISALMEEEELPEASEEDLKEKTEKLKNRLDNFGPINPMAMEAFNEMNERYEFIIKEKNDLIEAKDSLLNTIREIDETAETQFMDAFNKIRDHFQQVFRSLFREQDSCDLFLTEPDNPLESPIEIVARPKGKRPLSINQLSGGEKTLTATAILFSLYLLKPAPFCIFDEVDAPLDDTNIDKFNNIIREFSKESQFIIVTHNKRTIASTDVVYGVTMVEEGISRVVPVDLRDFEAAS